MHLVAILEVKAGEQILGQDEAEGIADLADLEDIAFDLDSPGGFVHGAAPVLYRLYNTGNRRPQRPPEASMVSSSAIIPSIMFSPICQKPGSRASRPKGASSSE